MKKNILIAFSCCLLLFSSLSFAGSVNRSQFTTEMDGREPTDMVVTLSSDVNRIIYFTELSDLAGHKVTHQWVYNGNVMFEKTFDVGANHWRVWSSKTLQPGWTGRWTVNTLDEDGSELSSQVFEYQ
jgi:hypothetical protein